MGGGDVKKYEQAIDFFTRFATCEKFPGISSLRCQAMTVWFLVGNAMSLLMSQIDFNFISKARPFLKIQKK
jgi:hypothetical protein